MFASERARGGSYGDIRDLEHGLGTLNKQIDIKSACSMPGESQNDLDRAPEGCHRPRRLPPSFVKGAVRRSGAWVAASPPKIRDTIVWRWKFVNRVQVYLQVRSDARL